jgi:hypothetical protein
MPRANGAGQGSLFTVITAGRCGMTTTQFEPGHISRCIDSGLTSSRRAELLG